MFGVSGFVPSGVQAYVEGQKRSQKKRIIIPSGKSDRISSVFLAFVLNKGSNHTFIRFFVPDFFNIPLDIIPACIAAASPHKI